MLKHIFKDSIVYGIGAIIPKAVTFLTLPILISYLTPEQYGEIELFITIGLLASIIVGFGLDNSLSYYYFKYRRQRGNIIKTIVITRLTISFLLVFFVFSLVFFFDHVDLDKDSPLILVIVNVFLFQFSTLFIEIYRLEFKAKWFIFATNITSLSSTAFSILFCVYLEFDVWGYFLGVLLSTGLSVCAFFYLRRTLLLASVFDLRIMWKVLKFGLPMLPAALSMYVVTSIDKWAINHYLTKEDLAIYSMALQLTYIFKLSIEVFRKAWWPYAVRALAKRGGSDLFRNVSDIYGITVSFGMILFFIILPIAFNYLSNEFYLYSKTISLVLIIESALYGYFMVACLGPWKVEKTHYNTLLMFVSALLNIILNYIFIPEFGLIGAAYATVISSLVWILVSVFVSTRLVDFGIRWYRAILLMILSYFLVNSLRLDLNRGTVVAILLCYVVLIFYTICKVYFNNRVSIKDEC